MAFLPDRVMPFCEDPAAAVIISGLLVTDARGLAQLPPPPPPGGGDVRGRALGGGSAVGVSGCWRSISIIFTANIPSDFILLEL